jgi:hypothetical protein
MFIVIRIREVYGRRIAYPVCDKAKEFARIAGTKTLSRDNLYSIEELGFVVKVDATLTQGSLVYWNGEI